MVKLPKTISKAAPPAIPQTRQHVPDQVAILIMMAFKEQMFQYTRDL
jgi:hypothetical protein